MVKIILLAEDNCISSSISGAIDTFSIANLWWTHSHAGEGPLFETEIATLDKQPVHASGGITITPAKSIEEVVGADLIQIPAFPPPFVMYTPIIKDICDRLVELYESGVKISSTCTGSFLLAKTGLLDEKLATTNWQFASLFRKKYPNVDLRIDRILTEDSGLYCTGAATAFVNLCLHLIESHGSPELASLCAKSLLVDPERKTQAPFIIHNFYKNHNDDKILNAQSWIEENYSDKISIENIARTCGMSPRQFSRRFRKATGETPVSYIQWFRIEKAKRMLETTQNTINEITWDVGYNDINSFRRLFIKHTGMSPRRYRNKFSLTFDV